MVRTVPILCNREWAKKKRGTFGNASNCTEIKTIKIKNFLVGRHIQIIPDGSVLRRSGALSPSLTVLIANELIIALIGH